MQGLRHLLHIANTLFKLVSVRLQETMTKSHRTGLDSCPRLRRWLYPTTAFSEEA